MVCVVPVDSEGKEIEKFKSNEWKFTMPLLEKPELIEPIDNQKDVSLTPTFKWKYKDENYIDLYRLYVVDGESNKEVFKIQINRGEVKKETLTQGFYYTLPSDKKLKPGKTYFWNVEALKYSVNGKLSANIKGDKRTLLQRKRVHHLQLNLKRMKKLKIKPKKMKRLQKIQIIQKKMLKQIQDLLQQLNPPKLKKLENYLFLL